MKKMMLRLLCVASIAAAFSVQRVDARVEDCGPEDGCFCFFLECLAQCNQYYPGCCSLTFECNETSVHCGMTCNN
jgi:hypothetical protein